MDRHVSMMVKAFQDRISDAVATASAHRMNPTARDWLLDLYTRLIADADYLALQLRRTGVEPHLLAPLDRTVDWANVAWAECDMRNSASVAECLHEAANRLAPAVAELSSEVMATV